MLKEHFVSEENQVKTELRNSLKEVLMNLPPKKEKTIKNMHNSANRTLIAMCVNKNMLKFIAKRWILKVGNNFLKKSIWKFLLWQKLIQEGKQCNLEDYIL